MRNKDIAVLICGLTAILSIFSGSRKSRVYKLKGKVTNQKIVNKVMSYKPIFERAVKGSWVKNGKTVPNLVPGVPADWVIDWGLATIDHESDGKERATSYRRKGVNNSEGDFILDKNGNKIPLAKGVGQFIDSTSVAFGVSDPYDPEDIIPGMVRLLSHLYAKKNGELDRIANSYYAGAAGLMPQETRVNKDGSIKRNSAKGAENKQKYIDVQLALYEVYKSL